MRHAATPRRHAATRTGRGRRDAGQATAELAVGLPTLFVVFLLAAWLLGAVSAAARCADAARIGARLAARGEPDASAAAMAARAAPPGAEVRIRHGNELVNVEVSARIGAAGLGRLVPDLVVNARAVAAAEATNSPPAPAPANSPTASAMPRPAASAPARAGP